MNQYRKNKSVSSIRNTVLFSALFAVVANAEESNWWKSEWTNRQALTLDTTVVSVADPIGSSTILVRLHDGNFQFGAAREDGSDIRFVAADGKSELSHQIEKYDGMLHEAFIWVKIPELKSNASEKIWMYYGNAELANAAEIKASDAYDTNLSLVYHFTNPTGNPTDSSVNGNNAESAAIVVAGSLIGGGQGFVGGTNVTVPNSTSLEWTQGQTLTWSAWVKPAALQANAVLFDRSEGSSHFRILLDQGAPIVSVAGTAGAVKTSAAAPIAAASWSHLAITSDGAKLTVFVNGVQYATVTGVVSVMKSPLTIGSLSKGVTLSGNEAFNGEMDEVQIAKVARSAGWLKFAATTQGSGEAAAKSIVLAEMEGAGEKKENKMMEHVSLFGDIAKNMMFDGWIAIGVCVLMICVGWTVAVQKFFYLRSIQKGSVEFLKHWKSLSSNLTELDHSDDKNVSTLAGKVTGSMTQHVAKSPLYHLYHIGSEEINHRIEKPQNKNKGLSNRSIQAIKASLDAGLVHEHHRLNKGLVFLTMSIAGGPYVGLLGTVVGVMITFAIIAKSGEVDVNSIAPGIASALLATVVGLVVAIPALFIYSFLNGQIKENIGKMQVFIDEFVAKMAEFYPKPNND
jgi:biopolymer transport protein ExbB